MHCLRITFCLTYQLQIRLQSLAQSVRICLLRKAPEAQLEDKTHINDFTKEGVDL